MSKICLECGDIHDEDWDDRLEMNEPYFILGVCFFCRVESEPILKKTTTVKMNIERYCIHISNKATVYDLKCPICSYESRELVKNNELPNCKKCELK